MTEDQFTPAASEWFHPDPEIARNARVPDYESTLRPRHAGH